MPTPTPDRYTLVIAGDSGVFYLSGGTIKIDPAKQPHTFDLAIKEGRYAGHTMLGVYELNGTTLKLAMPSSAARAGLRPAGLKSDDVVHSLYTFERDPKATKEAVAAELKQRKTALAVGPQPAAVPVVQPTPDVLQRFERLTKLTAAGRLEKKIAPARRSSDQYDRGETR